MLYKDFIKQLNFGMLIKGYRIESSGTEAEIVQRAAMLSKYTGTFEHKGDIIGVRPMSVQERDMLSIHWAVDALQKQGDSYVIIGHVREQGLLDKFLFDPTDDIDTRFAELGFVVHSEV